MTTRVNYKVVGSKIKRGFIRSFVISLIFVFCYNYPLHSVIIKDESALASAKALAEDLASTERKILELKEQKRAQQDQLKLTIAQLVQNTKVQLQKEKVMPTTANLSQDTFKLNNVKVPLSDASKSKRLEEHLREVNSIKPINVERVVQNKLLEAILKDHVCKMWQVIDRLKPLRKRVVDMTMPGITDVNEIYGLEAYNMLLRDVEYLRVVRIELDKSLEKRIQYFDTWRSTSTFFKENRKFYENAESADNSILQFDRLQFMTKFQLAITQILTIKCINGSIQAEAKDSLSDSSIDEIKVTYMSRFLQFYHTKKMNFLQDAVTDSGDITNYIFTLS